MTTYTLADERERALLESAMKSWHGALAEQGVRVGMLLASNADGPSVSHGGYPALATIRVVPLKDRLTKNYDAEMLISAH